MLQYLPNTLTVLRLALAVPLGFLILRQDFAAALAVGLVAGITDLLDGFFARRLQAHSNIGAALDPVADKTLITVCFLCCAVVELMPWFVAAVVIARDLVIVTGAACYAALYGPFKFAATRLSKGSMFVQISFCLLVLLSQIVSGLPAWTIPAGIVLVILFAVASGIDYVFVWARKAVHEQRSRQQP